MTINLVSVSGQAYVSGNYVNIASIVADTYDRKGTIIWYDDFEHGFNKWIAGGVGTGNSVDITSATALTKDSCCMLTCGNDALLYSSLMKYLNLYSNSNLGFEFSFAIDSHIDHIEIRIAKYEKTQLKFGTFQIYTSGNSQYIKSDATWAILDNGLEFDYYSTHWYTAKIVLNFDENKYVRIIHRDKIHDINAALRTYPLTLPERIEVRIRAYGTATLPVSNAKAYIDNFIITQDEP